MRKRDTTKPVEDEESAPVSLHRILQAFQIIFEVSSTGKPLIISSSHFPNVLARWCRSIVRGLKQPDRAVNVKIEPMHIFLCRDGN